MYVGIVDKKFVSPNDMITKEMASELRTNSQIRLETSKTILKGMLNDIGKVLKGIKEIGGDDEYKIEHILIDNFFKE